MLKSSIGRLLAVLLAICLVAVACGDDEPAPVAVVDTAAVDQAQADAAAAQAQADEAAAEAAAAEAAAAEAEAALAAAQADADADAGAVADLEAQLADAQAAADAADAEATAAAEQAAAAEAAAEEAAAAAAAAAEPPKEDVTLRVLVHQNPPMVEFMEAFNDSFEAANPHVTVDMSVVAPGDLSISTQTRLTAGDIDVIDIFGFSNAAQPYMSGIQPPNWQTLIEAGLLMDLTRQPFVDHYDRATLDDAGSFEGRLYAINLGRVSYSGMFLNLDLFDSVGVDVPTTWGELVAACDTFKASGNECMTLGGGDGWPIFVGAYGLLGAMYPDQEALVEGLWTGAIRWDDERSTEMLRRMQVFTTEMLEDGVSGLSHDAAPARFAAGDVAMMPTGVWQAPALDDVGFDWTYIPFPGSDDPEDNKYLFGKYDQGWAIAADTPHPEESLAYLAAFSEPDNYQAFANAVGFIPTQPTAGLNTKLGAEVAPYLANYRVGFEQYWAAPAGAGQWSNASQAPAWFAPFNEWTDAAALAAQAQADLQAGLDAG
ncbi:MAG: extracellular solute-binding protein [Acidimicrobiaceae bacterium]|nr:extracellular solute-binding protein [Acidimicrobiaceae bacterium]